MSLDTLFTPRNMLIALIVYFVVTNFSDKLPFMCEMKSRKKEPFVTDYSSFGTVPGAEEDEEDEEDEEEEDEEAAAAAALQAAAAKLLSGMRLNKL